MSISRRLIGLVALTALASVACGSDKKPSPVQPSKSPPAVQAAADGEPKAVHGMIVFGQSSVFVSHLPMFGAPHDYQIVAEVKLLSEPGAFPDGFLTGKNPAGYHTIAPEPFELSNMQEVGFRFPATLHEGHFERGGKAIGPLVIEVVRVLRYKKLDRKDKTQGVYQGIVFGNGRTGEYYLVHRIQGAPSFDQISLVAEGAPGPSEVWGAGLEVVSLDKPEKPLERYDELQLSVGGKPMVVKTRAIYTEVGELK